MTGRLLVFGGGYSGLAIAGLAERGGWEVDVAGRGAKAGVRGATHIVVTVPPGEGGDPILAGYGGEIEAAGALRWIGYLSTTGVYGDRGGGWVDETTTVAPGSARSRRRVEAEAGWGRFGDRVAVDVFRLAGIYGPGRSAFDDLRAGRARRIVAAEHRFGRIHRDDIAGAVVAGMGRGGVGVRVLNGADDVPASSAEVIEEAARLLGVEAPAAVSLAEAWAGMSEMGRSFWAENRRVSSRMTQRALGRRWLYPSYREGLRAILAGE